MFWFTRKRALAARREFQNFRVEEDRRRDIHMAQLKLLQAATLSHSLNAERTRLEIERTRLEVDRLKGEFT